MKGPALALPALPALSPRFVYSECKKIDGMPDEEGTTIRAAMQVFENKGVCQEKFWPYQPHQKDKPKEGAAVNVKKFCVMTYARILNLNELRMSLATKGPAVLGIQVFKGMLKTKTGIVPMPRWPCNLCCRLRRCKSPLKLRHETE